ncbi:TetR/AcrR family transcriptional regulator [Phreatobacter aquaticus]|nr:TetR/AcrR family transcriptional regulator [Phreatobacter aquaticus]
MPRLSRADQKAETSRRLIEAAHRLYLAHGLDGVSVDAVAEAAGFSKGAVYANFSGKEALLLSVWQSHYAAKRDRLAEALASGDDLAGVIAAIRAVMVTFFSDGPWALLQAEVRRRAADLPLLSRELAAMERAEMAEMQGLVGQFVSLAGLTPRIAIADMTETLAALFDGLVIRAAADSVSPEQLADRFVGVLVALAGIGSRDVAPPR